MLTNLVNKRSPSGFLIVSFLCAIDFKFKFSDKDKPAESLRQCLFDIKYLHDL